MSLFASWQGDLYFFPWWPWQPQDPGVQRLKFSDWSVSTVMSDLGAYVFAASSGPGCKSATSQ